jgi:hypothetical protein
VWASHMTTWSSFLSDLAPPNSWKAFDLVVFDGVLGEVVSEVDFRFLLIWWVLGLELLAKGSPWGTPTIPKVSFESLKRIGISFEVNFEFFPQVEFFPTAQAKPAWPVSWIGLTGLVTSAFSRRVLGRQASLSLVVAFFVQVWLGLEFVSLSFGLVDLVGNS